MNIDQLRDTLKIDEGVKYEIYNDHLGYPTFGIGHLVVESDDEHGKPVGTQITEDRVNSVFEKDVAIMINEAKKVCELYLHIIPFIDEFDVEIHLDVNTDPKHGSYCAVNEAAGYVLGMTGIEPKLKPHGFAASYGADGVAHGRG